MAQHQFDAQARHQLEAGEVAPRALRSDAEEAERRFDRGQADEGDLDRARARYEPQHRRGDHAQRAFGADEQVLQIVAGVVLLQLVEIVEDAPVGEHHLDAQYMGPRDAVSERLGAAGIGRKVAADGAGSFRRQQLRVEAIDRGGRLARALQGDAGLAGDGVRRRVDLADAVEARERQDDLIVEGDLPADEAGIAALRHDRRCRLVRELEDLHDLGDGAGRSTTGVRPR